MGTEQLHEAYAEIRPSPERKAAMLEAILAAEPAPAPRPAHKRRRWLITALGAAAVLCLIFLPRPAPEPEEPPQHPMLQAAPRPQLPVGSSAPLAPPPTLTVEGKTYALSPDRELPPCEEELAETEAGILYAAGDNVVLVTETSQYLYVSEK